MIKILSLVLVLSLSSCISSGDDGYKLGDGTRAAAETAQGYCKPVYVPIRFVGRWLLRFIGYPIPDVCRVGRSVIQ